MSDEIHNINHINLNSINEQSVCNHHNHNHIENEDDVEENKEGNPITTFVLGDDKHPIDEEDEVKLFLLP
jgi:hypothetical protein